MSEQLLHRAYNRLKEAQLSIGVCAMMAMTNAWDRHEMMVYANDPLSEQAERALPSALPAPVVTGNLVADIAIQTASTFAATESARQHSSAKQLLGSAVTAQVISCGLDAGVERIGWLTPAERAQPDIGFSAINAAWLSTLVLNRADQAKTPLRRNLWRAGLVTFAGAITIGSYFLFGPTGEKLDVTSHAAGVAVGVSAYLLGKRKKNQQEAYPQIDDRVLVDSY